jgi:hypothetical protein
MSCLTSGPAAGISRHKTAISSGREKDYERLLLKSMHLKNCIKITIVVETAAETQTIVFG